MDHKCHTTMFGQQYLRNMDLVKTDEIVFTQGEWYIEDWKFEVIDITYYSIFMVNSSGRFYTIDEKEFKEHFYTRQEVREQTIDKILK